MQLKKVRFNKELNKEFVNTVRSRVQEYFDSNKISKYANANMVLKTIFMILLYLTPYFIMVTGVVTNIWLIMLCFITMGFGFAGIGLSVMHDANHGSYSRNKFVNRWLGYLLNFLGGSATNWRIQHNILHHTYTNIDHMDEDINPGNILRFSPHQKKYAAHKWQHIYGWFLYGLMTIMWTMTKDFRQLYRYKGMDLTKTEKKSFNVLLFELILSKIIYYGYIFVIPLIVLPITWWQFLLFYVLMHYVGGLLLAIVFQPAHVMVGNEYPLPDEVGYIDNNWAIHQLITTTNYSPKSTIFSWFIGGLNYQIEHHLFPNICHVHYKKISKIVKKTALEFELPYNMQQNFLYALINHGRMLKMLGNS